MKNALKHSIYEQLPIDVLGGFYYHINLNIEKGILTEAMHQEIALIEDVAHMRGIPLKVLYREGFRMVMDS